MRTQSVVPAVYEPGTGTVDTLYCCFLTQGDSRQEKKCIPAWRRSICAVIPHSNAYFFISARAGTYDVDPPPYKVSGPLFFSSLLTLLHRVYASLKPKKQPVFVSRTLPLPSAMATAGNRAPSALVFSLAQEGLSHSIFWVKIVKNVSTLVVIETTMT